MNTVKPQITAIIVGTNEKSWLFECLASLTKSSYSGVEILFIDNFSSDGSSEYVSELFPAVTIIRTKSNLGFSGANNIGIKHSIQNNSKYILLINPDTITPEGLINHLVDFMEANPTFGIIGPLQTEYHDKYQLNGWSKHALENQDRSVFHHWNSWKPNISDGSNKNIPNILEHSYIQGAAFFFRSEIVQKIGLLEEVYHTYYEEVDFCRKARWVGYKVALLLNLTIQHFGGGGSIKNSLYRNYHYSRNKYIYLYSDPEYSYKEIFILNAKWIVNDIKDLILKKHNNISNLKQLIKIFSWLLINCKTLIKMRNNNRKTFNKKSDHG